MKNQLSRALFILMILFSSGYILTANAITLADAKAQGLVGEQPNGYVGIVGTTTPELKTLVNDINKQRHDSYVQIALHNGTTIDAVETLAGQKAIGLTQTGNYIKTPSGDWVKK